MKNASLKTTSSPPPCVVIIDFARVFYLYSPETSPYSHLFSNDEVSDREALLPILKEFGIRDIIETLYINVGEDIEPMAFLWEVFEHRMPEVLERLCLTDGAAIESFDFLVSQIDETVATTLQMAFIKAGLRPRLMMEYFFNNWVSATAAAFAHKDYDTSE